MLCHRHLTRGLSVQCGATCGGVQSAPIVAVFYAAYFMATNYIILNLIIGTVLEQFVVRNQEKRNLQRRAAIREAANKQVPTTSCGNLCQDQPLTNTQRHPMPLPTNAP